MDCSMPDLPVHHQLLEPTQTYFHWVGDGTQPLNPLCPLLLLPSVFPSIRVFPNEWALRIRWPKYWSFSFNISPSNEYPGLISCKIDWLDFLAVQGTLKSLLQHHSVSSVYFSHPFVFYLFVCLYSYIVVPCLLILFVRLSFIEMSKPFTFNVVIERLGVSSLGIFFVFVPPVLPFIFLLFRI